LEYATRRKGPNLRFRYYYLLRKRTERRAVVAYLEGRLRENVPVSGEEHTGYVLEVEVDMSAVQDTEELVNGQVAMTGSLEFADYPERGKELVFRATSAAVIEEEVEETG
jgi:hypothetical protein